MPDHPFSAEPRAIARALALDTDRGLTGWSMECPLFANDDSHLCRRRDGRLARPEEACHTFARAQAIHPSRSPAGGLESVPENGNHNAGPGADTWRGEVP